MRFTLLSLGCKVNQAEVTRMTEQLAAAGHEIVPIDAHPDYCILNTCSVTAKADYQSRQLIRGAARSGAQVIATGCFAELNKAEAVELGAGKIVSNKDKLLSISEFIGNTRCDTLTIADKARYTLKVQDGCNNACSYCLIPSARGESRSVGLDRVIDEAKRAIEAGYREIVLTGVHLGQYGLDFNLKFADLLENLLIKTNIARFRLSSLEVTELDDRLLELIADARVCRHLHIPLQGGDDALLSAMNRNYDIKRFAAAIKKVHARLGELALGTDVISGFPGETGAMHDNTLDLLNKLPVTYLHVFPFSPRPNTAAQRMPDNVGPALRKARTLALRALSDAKKQLYLRAQLGQTLEVLIESVHGAQEAAGTSGNYAKVRVLGKALRRGIVVRAKIVGIEGLRLVGNHIESC